MLVKTSKEEIEKLSHLNEFKLCHSHTETIHLNDNEEYYIFKKNNEIVGYIIIEIISDIKNFMKERQFDSFFEKIKNEKILIIKQVSFDFNKNNKFVALEFFKSIFSKYPTLAYVSLVRLTNTNKKFLPYLKKYYSNYKLLKNYWENKNIACTICSNTCQCKSVLLLKEANVNPFELNTKNLTTILSSLFK